MRKFFTVIILLVILCLGIFLWWKNGITAVNSKDTTQKIFVIPKGSSVRTIGNELKSEGLIRDPVVFFIYIKKNGLDHNVQAGSYRLSPSMDLPKIIETLGHGTVDVWVTIPEGLRSEEIAQILKANLPSYQSSWKNLLKAQEGYLFPDTYLIPKDANIGIVISLLKNNFYRKIESIGLSKTTPNLDKIITEASLIEREAKFAVDRPYVASVIQNRLTDGMALQIDATVQYALGYNDQTKKWWNVVNAQQLKIDSPYNTYIYTGLPPGPICNPGLSAIQAASNPSKTNYLYYVNDSTGKLHFAENIADHNKNIQRYLK